MQLNLKHPSSASVKELVVLVFGLLFCVFAHAAEPTNSEFDWAPDYQVGDQFPEFNMLSQAGKPITDKSLTDTPNNSKNNTLDNSLERKGYLIAFNRSVVW